MSEPATDPLADLKKEFTDFQVEIRELIKASTVAERADAREDVADAEADVIAAAKRAGLKPEQVQRALAEAKRAAFREEHGEEISAMIRTELETLMKEAEAKEAKEGTSKDEATAAEQKPKAEKKPKADEPEPDAAPERPHWSEKSVTELIR